MDLGLQGKVGMLLTIPVFLACSGGGTTPAPTLTPVLSGALSAYVISTDLSVDSNLNRLVFLLLDRDSMPVRVDEAEVSVYHPVENVESKPTAVAKARFRQWPLGERGVYTAQLKFDQAGDWALRVAVAAPDGSTESVRADFRVKEKSDTPATGSPAPPSLNKTIRDVGTLEELTTARPPDPDLYSMTIADAVVSGKPVVLVFATPAFCETATCGPQVEVLEGIKDRYKDRANFIHIEMFDNPHEIQGDPDRARTAAAVAEWGLRSEPWTFIVDHRGRIAAKFEGFTTTEEIEEGLEKVLQ